MQILTTIQRNEGVNINGRTIHRTAVRAVIQRGHELLMVYSANVGDYKFPGGGVDAGESHGQALARELREECGAELLSVDGELGAIIEYKIAEDEDFDTFKMTSYYYVCRVNEELSEQNLDGYEKDLGFQPVWVDIDAALAKNKSLLDANDPPDWLRREIFALEDLRAE
jgi:8-oxo-dGTP pyrophosphatase MutT (NUDIX family)